MLRACVAAAQMPTCAALHCAAGADASCTLSVSCMLTLTSRCQCPIRRAGFSQVYCWQVVGLAHVVQVWPPCRLIPAHLACIVRGKLGACNGLAEWQCGTCTCLNSRGATVLARHCTQFGAGALAAAAAEARVAEARAANARAAAARDLQPLAPPAGSGREDTRQLSNLPAGS
jgi:hypothetical protein